MSPSSVVALTGRDHAVLRAIAAGRCAIADDIGIALVVDGLPFCDQRVAPSLAAAGLIDPTPGRARLTASGRAQLKAVFTDPALSLRYTTTPVDRC